MKTIKMILQWISWLLTVALAFMLCCNLYLIAAKKLGGQEYPTVFGYTTAVVISGSMEDSISVNDMVLIHKQENYAVGDVITFDSGNSAVTHRIIEKKNGEFITKGDANNTADTEPVSQEAVIGRVVRVIPKIGLLIDYLRTPLGMCCLTLVGCLLVVLPAQLRREDEIGGDMDDNKTK